MSSLGPSALSGYVRIDAVAELFLAFVNPIFLGISAYVWNRVTVAPTLVSELRRFVPCALLFFLAVNTVFIANHLLLLWLSLEVSTFAVAPLIARKNHRASYQASFRYLLFSSVGLGLFLLGITCWLRSLEGVSTPTLFLDQLASLPQSANDIWSKLGLLLMLLGLGTKLGLAPMYSWLPEAYDEAPPAVAALLGGVQFNATLVVLLRVVHGLEAAHGTLITSFLLGAGLISMGVSTTGVIATRNMKRLIAYASVNHAGVIAIGIGTGKEGAYGLLLYVISNAFIKTILFLTAGKIEAHYGTKETLRIGGLLKDLPYSGVFLMVGTFALLGFPPFGSFFGELLVLSALVSSHRLFVFAAFCLLITMTFVATGRSVFPMIWGEPKQPRSWPQQRFGSALPKLLFLCALVVLGLYIPAPVNALIQAAAQSLGGT